jgi:beta-glucuronidase
METSRPFHIARLQHTPVADTLLDWADEHGMLIIAEAGNW